MTRRVTKSQNNLKRLVLTIMWKEIQMVREHWFFKDTLMSWQKQKLYPRSGSFMQGGSVEENEDEHGRFCAPADQQS